MVAVGAAATMAMSRPRLFGTRGRSPATASSSGLLEQAGGGTLFLNELGDMSDRGPAPAGRDARVPQRSAASAAPSRWRSDARLVSSAACRHRRSRVDRGEFRRDLFNQLDVVQLRIPPLRDYREDVPDLLRYYVDLLVDAEGLKYRRFSVAAQNRLRNYPWPGNVREVKNIVHRLLALGGADEISLEEVEGVIAARGQRRAAEPLVKQDLLAHCRCARRARPSSAPTSIQQLELAGGRVSASSLSESAWSAPTSTASSSSSASRSAARRKTIDAFAARGARGIARPIIAGRVRSRSTRGERLDCDGRALRRG